MSCLSKKKQGERSGESGDGWGAAPSTPARLAAWAAGETAFRCVIVCRRRRREVRKEVE